METTFKKLISIPTDRTILLDYKNEEGYKKTKIVKLLIQEEGRFVKLGNMSGDDRLYLDASAIPSLKKMIEFLENEK